MVKLVPATSLPDVFELSYYANAAMPIFATESVLGKKTNLSKCIFLWKVFTDENLHIAWFSCIYSIFQHLSMSLMRCKQCDIIMFVKHLFNALRSQCQGHIYPVVHTLPTIDYY